jgi:hypothetical protein
MADKKATAAALDFTNVKDGGNFNKRHQAPGDYPAKIKSVADAVKKDDKNVKMWLFTIEVGSGTYPFYCVHAENQLWKIRNIFIAAGVNIPKKRVNLDPNKLVGKKIGVSLEDEEYEGKMQSVVQSTFPLSELEGADLPDADEGDDDLETVEEAPVEKAGKKSKEDPGDAPQEGKKKKKGKKKKGSDDVSDKELESLDIEDI